MRLVTKTSVETGLESKVWPGLESQARPGSRSKACSFLLKDSDAAVGALDGTMHRGHQAQGALESCPANLVLN
ncbi:hypothetical protein EVAR_841_1 [Eumeta japonica]|uniref:Uncharacterized protein n=1 Tax=Eumeta variegata TaxID=151549 RepID=A0A4C1SFR6_EUMVA|nr:hypothetical protein EVAR_841_1 [Eumeta japonica]